MNDGNDRGVNAGLCGIGIISVASRATDTVNLAPSPRSERSIVRLDCPQSCGRETGICPQMAETTNIAKMAEILSQDLFGDFLWQHTGPTNTNWPCEEQELHKAKTHPSDVVFYYDNPYRLSRTYVNCDLKSYARGSIKTVTCPHLSRTRSYDSFRFRVCG
jgi:hypothetical protein